MASDIRRAPGRGVRDTAKPRLTRRAAARLVPSCAHQSPIEVMLNH